MTLQSRVAPAVVALAAAGLANAWFRVACTLPIVQERVDPIVQPGIIGQHLHTIHGGSNFGMNLTFDSLRASSCTSCEVAQDLSNYWTPTLYFKDPTNGKFEKVPDGGLLVYYENRGNGDASNGGPGLKAFPAGFQMLSGSATKRSQIYTPGQGSQGELAERAITSSCLRYNTATTQGYDYIGFPHTDCEAGINARLQMPTCWDGKNNYLPGNTHVAYLSGLDNGACDSAHPIYLMHMFYEVTWDISSFRSRWVPQGYKWPFVWSNGDPTGFGWHGDFFNGWDVGVLQNAIDRCNTKGNEDQMAGKTVACPYLTVTSADFAGQCKIRNVEVPEPGGLTAPIDKLPGCNYLQAGPCDATLSSVAACPASPPTCNGNPPPPPPPPPATTTTAAPPPGNTGTAGVTYVGCYTDAGNSRTLNAYATTINGNTNALCAQTCFGKGYSYSGTEYGTECYCGNGIASGFVASEGDCNASCPGSSSTKCGGTFRISVSRKS